MTIYILIGEIDHKSDRHLSPVCGKNLYAEATKDAAFNSHIFNEPHNLKTYDRFIIQEWEAGKGCPTFWEKEITETIPDSEWIEYQKVT